MTMEQERMNTIDYDETFSDDMRALREYRELRMKRKSEEIAVIQQGDGWFAFGDDADKLFLQIGWQTSAKLMDEGAISWMDISESGMMALKLSGIEVAELRPKFGVSMADWSSEKDYKDNRLSLAQQTMDYLRFSNGNREAIVNLGKYPVHTVKDGIDTMVNICFVRFSGQDVSLLTESGRTVNLVTGPMWNVAMAGDYIISTGNMMDAQREDVLHTLKHYDQVEMQRLLRTEDVMEEYSAVLAKYRYDHVLMEQKDFYEALGDEAVSMASKYHLQLWDRDAGNGQSVPMVMLSMNQVDRVLSESDDVLIEESRIMELRDELALKPSPLNDGLHETLHFNESGIKKTRNGDFMVWARLNGVDLPDKEISPEMGIRYLRLTGGAEKEVVLRAALQQSYGAEISQMATRSQSAMVKI